MVDPPTNPPSWLARLRSGGLAPQIFGGIIGRFVGGLLLTAFIGFLGVIGALPLIQRWTESFPPAVVLSDWIYGLRVHPMPAGSFNIVVADLDGDDSGSSNTSHIINSLDSQLNTADLSSGVKVQRAQRRIRIGDAMDNASEIAAAQSRARMLLRKLNGDVLVWGSVERGGSAAQVLRLRVTLKEGSSENRATSYSLTPALELPDKFGSDLAGALAALAASESMPALDEGRFIVGVLSPLKPKLEALLANPPQAIGPEQIMTLRGTFGLLLDRLGDQKRDYAMLERAAAEFTRVAAFWEKRDPERQALALCNLGRTLLTLSERAGGQARVKEAITAFDTATSVLKPGDSPQLWAIARSRLAEALRQLGEMEEGGGRLAESEAAARAALGALAPGKDTQRLRAQMLNQLGDILRARGEYEGRPDLLSEAEKALREAIAGLPVDQYALLWAEATGNLADVLRLEGEAANSVKTLEESANTYAAAFNVWTANQQALDAASVRFKQCMSVRLIGEREPGGKRLGEALGLCEQGVKGLSRQDSPVLWGEAQMALARVLLAIGSLDKETARIEAARTANGQAVDVFRQERAQAYLKHALEDQARIAAAITAARP